MAQTKVTGTVYEPDGTTPVIGASVVQVGTNHGTSTDLDGKFSLNVKGKKPVLRVSYVGYPATKVTVENDQPLKIVMKDGGVNLDEVVVTALG
ncbi:MAG: carboxypeptidase-like regulatory domain-containing protein, partial [Muribaculaceae bacterium]|nr:carboxypeptidase-like regulatory domain-containing protein [Muribaculaceae bacterium]